MKIKEYALLAIGGGISLVLMAVTVALLIRYSAQYRRVSEELQARTSELAVLQRRDPFPSEENVARAEISADELRRGLDRLVAEISDGQRELVLIDRPQWPLLRQRVFGGLNDRARNSHVRLPDGFAYGFERYAGPLPEARHLPRVIRQLDYVEWMCGVLLDSKVHTILRIERHLFEDEAAAADAWGDDRIHGLPTTPQTAAGRRPARPDRRAGAAFAPGYRAHPESLYSRERMVFAFTGRESALWEVLNTLAGSDVFSVVSRIQVRNPALQPGTASARRAAGGPGAAAARRAQASSWEDDLDDEGPGMQRFPLRSDGTPVPPARTERIVAGRDELLEIEMEVDFYRFRRGDVQPEGASL